MWTTIVFVLLFPGTAWPIEDRRGPYQTKEECFIRGAELIRDISLELPIIKAEVSCEKDRDKEWLGADQPII
tara:strand:+ start:1569 stop:1784 length:216 start_codon:yes stop_codon:yes gene_type:complete